MEIVENPVMRRTQRRRAGPRSRRRRRSQREKMDFCWSFMRRKDSVIEALLCLFFFNLNKYGTFYYEFLGFTHEDIDQLFHWQRNIQ